MRRSALTVFLVLTTAIGISANDVRPAYLSREAEVRLPAGYRRNRTYPVFVVLPPTGVEPSRIVRSYGLDPERQDQFILLLPPGGPTRDEYLPDFPGFVAAYEERVLADIAALLENYRVDPDRIYLGGYSLGGDLSWALSVRNPDVFAGAVIAGSRTSHPVEETALMLMQERGFRAAFLIGNREDPLRYRGINVARGHFEDAGITHTYEEYRGGHVIPPRSTFQEAVRYVSEVGRLPPPGPVAGAPGSGGGSSGLSGAGGALLSHTSTDRFAVWGIVPADITANGLAAPRETGVGARVELPWPSFYLRSTAEYVSGVRTTDVREHRLSQDILAGVGTEAGRHIFGAGAGWDWLRTVAGDEAFQTVDILLMHGMRSPWIIPPGNVTENRLDSLLVLRYTLPRGAGASPAAEQVFNLRAEYLLRIADLFAVDVAGGSHTVQNRAVEQVRELSGALDHRLEWEVGVGLRAPSPLLWRVGYRGIGDRPLPKGDRTHRGIWSLTLEFSY